MGEHASDLVTIDTKIVIMYKDDAQWSQNKFEVSLEFSYTKNFMTHIFLSRSSH